jgi:molybdate transport repressor ModE-like protein
MHTSATVRLVPTLLWRPAGTGTTPLDARLVRLLAGVKRHATLRAAAREAGLSYRAAWGLLGDTGRDLGVPLVELRQGRGARLTEAGDQLLAANERLTQRLREESLALELAPPVPRTRRPARTRLEVVASHDLLLAAFCDQWARPEGIVAGVAFHGSIDSLKAFERGEADIAGFHTGDEPLPQASASLRRLLDPRRHALLRFAEREQGLIVPSGNPRGLRSLLDVARAGARFVNRQRGSGTRLLIDQLLKQAGVTANSVVGYETEEYTHLAVAATVATGQAEAGFGLRAAAARFGLDFVPLKKETYWLAVRTRRLETEPVRRLREGLAGEPLRRAGRGLAGYRIAGAGEVVSLAATIG